MSFPSTNWEKWLILSWDFRLQGSHFRIVPPNCIYKVRVSHEILIGDLKKAPLLNPEKAELNWVLIIANHLRVFLRLIFIVNIILRTNLRLYLCGNPSFCSFPQHPEPCFPSCPVKSTLYNVENETMWRRDQEIIKLHFQIFPPTNMMLRKTILIRRAHGKTHNKH